MSSAGADHRVNVATCFDTGMVVGAMALAASLKTHARAERPIRLFALTDVDITALAALAAEMNDTRFELVHIISENVYGTLPVRDHITAATYLRFLLPELLPTVEKVIYLDADIVVNSSIDRLFDTSLEGRAIAAVPDWVMLVGSRTWPTFFIPYRGRGLRFARYSSEVLGIDSTKTTSYFNCGVMVLNLDHWRRHDVAGQAVEFLSTHPGLYFLDQDALNAVICGDYVRLDMRWNCFANCSFPAYVNFIVRALERGRRWEAIRKVWREEPWIVHYAGANKPWMPNDPETAHDALWWRYASALPANDWISKISKTRKQPRQIRDLFRQGRAPLRNDQTAV